jgi:hypothetical protein
MLREDLGEVFGVGEGLFGGVGAVVPVGEGAGVEDLAVFFDVGPEEAVLDDDGFGEAIGLIDGGVAEGAVAGRLAVEQVEDEVAPAGPGDEGGGQQRQRENHDEDRLHAECVSAQK